MYFKKIDRNVKIQYILNSKNKARNTLTQRMTPSKFYFNENLFHLDVPSLFSRRLGRPLPWGRPWAGLRPAPGVARACSPRAPSPRPSRLKLGTRGRDADRPT